MSTEVRVKTRVIQKHGTSSDWNQATNFVPLQGEIIVYDDLKKFKIGDGTTSVIDLPFSALGIETITAGKGLTGGGSASSTTLNVGAGSGITVSEDAVAVNTTYTTTGKNYAVAVDTTSGGLYVTVPWTDTNTDTHYTTGINAGGTGATANAAVSNPYITIKDNSTYRGQIQLKGSGATSISSDANGVITIKSTDNNTTYSAATTSAAGLMSAADKTKLDGIATGADAVSLSRSLTSGTKIGTITINGTGTDLYCQTNTDTCNTAGSHEKSDKLFLVGCLSQGPYYETFSNSKCYASGGYLYSNGTKVLTSHQSLDNYSTLANTIKSLSISGKTITYTKGDGTTGTLTTQDTNTTYNAATQSAAGLMSANDKKKLDGIAANANNYTYTLPNASSSTLGGVKVGSNITVSSGTISLTKANVTAALGYTPPTSDTNTTYSAGTGISLRGTTFSLNSGYYATSANSGLMSASDKSKLDGIAAGATALSLGNTATTAAKGNHTHSTISNAFTVAAPTATTPNYPFQIKYNSSLIFKVRQDGTTYADKGYYSTGADYAEYFEWLDANSLGEDRRGLFVAMSDIDNSKMELAQNSDNIVGIVSANPSMVGNDAEMHWSKKYLTDVFGSYIMEEVTHPATVDQNGKLIPEYTTHEPKLNPEYNPDLEYIPRSQRKEWAVIGLLGQLVVCDDGSCWPGGYCKCGANGVATVSAEPGWRVLARLDENHIRILFK